MDNGIAFPELAARFDADPLSLEGKVPGVFRVNKPGGPSSHDVVALARKRLGLRRVGHGGTLDPLAEGLLLILAGNATRLFDRLQAFPKTYVARLVFGVRTDTCDAAGRVLAELPPERSRVERGRIEEALSAFAGEILQTPPMYSALKRGGRPLYELARAGVEVEREPRPVTAYALALSAFGDDDTGRTRAELSLRVSSGFYVRSLIDDLGQALGPGAHMTALTRTAIGPFLLEGATAPENLAAAG